MKSENTAASEIGRESQWSLLGALTCLLVVSLFMLAAALPDSLDEMPRLVNLLVDSTEWIKNIRGFAQKGNSPEFLRAYLALGLVATALCTATFLVSRTNSDMVPFPSSDRKFLAVGALILLVVLLTAIWWNVNLPSKPMGLLAGRWGALLHLALNSRLGAATVGIGIFFLGPHLAISLLWISIRRSTREARTFESYGNTK